jgi:DNA-binding CsgD family transcriptional regulator
VRDLRRSIEGTRSRVLPIHLPGTKLMRPVPAKFPDVSNSAQLRRLDECSLTGCLPMSEPSAVPIEARKDRRMATAQPTPRAGALSTGGFRKPDNRTIARYERELAEHISEEAKLRIALARAEALLRQLETLIRYPVDSTKPLVSREETANRAASLTPRQREVMELVLAGHPSKNIAADLGISRRTVENHRAAIMKKTGSKSLPALGRFGFAASAPIASAFE